MDGRAMMARGVAGVLGLVCLGYTLAGAGLGMWLTGAVGVTVLVFSRQFQPAVATFMALGLMATAYGVSSQGTSDLLWCVTLVGATGLVLAVSERSLMTWGVLVGLGSSLLVVILSLMRVGQDDAVASLVRGTTGLAAAGLVWGLWRLTAHARTTMEDPLQGDKSGEDPAVGWALVSLGITLPMGEGLAWASVGALVVTLAMARCSEASRRVLPLFTFMTPLVVWFLSGALAIWLGGFGWLDPGELGRWTPILLLPVVFLAACSAGEVWVARAATAFVATLAVAALIGIVQYAWGDTLVVWGRETLGLALPIKGQLARPGSATELVAGGFYGHRLKLAHVILVGLGVLGVRQIFSSMRFERRLGELVFVFILVLALGLTLARGAILGAAAGLGLLCFLAPRLLRTVTLAGGTLLFAGLLSVEEFRARISSVLSQGAVGDREVIWLTAAGVLEDSPVGVGLGNYSTLLTSLYQGFPQVERLPVEYAHSMVLSIWVEMGPVGLLAWTWFWWGLAGYYGDVVRAESRVRKMNSPACMAAILGLFVLITFWVVGWTHDVLYHKPVAMVFFAVMGACLGVIRRGKSFNVPDGSK